MELPKYKIPCKPVRSAPNLLWICFLFPCQEYITSNCCNQVWSFLFSFKCFWAHLFPVSSRYAPPDPPFLGHVPACFAHAELSLSGGVFLSLSILLLHSVNKGTLVTIPNCSFLFAWERSQLFVGLLLPFFFSFLFKLVTGLMSRPYLCHCSTVMRQGLWAAGTGQEEEADKAASCRWEQSDQNQSPQQHRPRAGAFSLKTLLKMARRILVLPCSKGYLWAAEMLQRSVEGW